MSRFEDDQQVSQVERCYHLLRNLIVTCELAPGVRLNERDLIERFACGRTPVREALLRLNQEGLIDTFPRSGYRVRPLTRKSVGDFFDVWRTIAPLIAKLAIPRFTAEHRAEMVKLAEQHSRFSEQDVVELAGVAATFFDILVTAADNEPLTKIYQSLGAENQRIYQLFFNTPTGRKWLISADAIAAFARIRSAEAAAERIKERLLASEQGILAMFDDQEAKVQFKDNSATSPCAALAASR